MKTQFEYDIMDAVFKAKLSIESLYPESVELGWFYTQPHHSFSDKRNNVEFYVLGGSHPRAFIIVNYSLRTVAAFDKHMRTITSVCV